MSDPQALHAELLGDLERISSYPCRTVRVIASALGVTTDG
jgi:hypothetical protein